MSKLLLRLLCVLPAIVATSLIAQSPVRVVEVGPIEAKSAATFGNVFGVAAMSENGLLVDDGIRHQLVLLDGTLQKRSVIFDSITDGTAQYGYRAMPIIPYLGDTVLFFDAGSRGMRVIAPNGSVIRVIALPRASDEYTLMMGPSATDPRGSLLYRSIPPAQTITRNADGAAQIKEAPDSATVLRVSFETRTVDSIGRVRAAHGNAMLVMADHKMHVLVNPVVAYDEWAMLTDGSVAFVRGNDYHIDWIDPSGKKFSSAKLPFDFKRISDIEKRALMDSAKRDNDKQVDAAFERERLRRASGASSAGGADAPVRAKNSVASEESQSLSIRREPTAPEYHVVDFAPMTEIADYYPPIRPNAAKADRDNNLWILPTTSAQSKNGELIYDVVNNKGVLMKRVRMPAGRSIAGFGKGGVLYLMGRDTNNQWFIERTHIPPQ